MCGGVGEEMDGLQDTLRLPIKGMMWLLFCLLAGTEEPQSVPQEIFEPSTSL